MKKRLFLLTALVALLGVGLYALTRPAPVAHAAPPTSHTIIRTSNSVALAQFSITQGDVTDIATVVASPEGFQQPTLVSGPAVLVSVVECTQVGEEAQCVSYDGIEPAPGFHMSKSLTSATLPAVTVPLSLSDEFGNPSGPPVFDVSVALNWTGVGAITRQSDVSHTRIGHTYIETFHGKRMFRDATVTGSVSYPSPYFGPLTLTGENSDYNLLVSQGTMDISIQR